MGKNKQQPQKKTKKDTSVFKVAGSKVHKLKHKAKPVITNLKKLDLKSKSAVENADVLYKEVKEISKTKAKVKETKAAASSLKVKCLPPADVDKAAEDISKL